MANIDKQAFTNDLALSHRAQMYPEERDATESILGEGAIKFKLSKGGLRSLFIALDQNKTDMKGR